MELGMLRDPDGTLNGGARVQRMDSAVATYGTGQTIEWFRYFFQTQSASAMGSTLNGLINPTQGVGRKVLFSWRPLTGGINGWNAVANGSEDSRLTAIGQMLASLTPVSPGGGMWCFNHEPENDNALGTHGSNTNGDAFRAAFDRCYSIIKPLAPNWRGCPILFDEVFPSWEFNRGGNWVANPDVNRWIPSNLDVLGVDYYAYRGASDGGSHWATNDYVYDHRTAIQDFIDHADARGVNLVIPEFSHLIKNPAGPDPNDYLERRAWVQDFADTWQDNTTLEALFWFEVSESDGSGKANYSLTHPTQPPMDPATVTAFTEFATVTPDPPPSSFVPGVVSPMTRVRMGSG